MSMSATSPPLSASFYNNANNPLANNNMNPSKPPSKKNLLRPAAVRERCKSIQGCKELKNKDPFSTTISFLILPTPPTEGEESKTQENPKLPLRISIFCDTGTIATAKVIDGQVRQSFRRNVTSLDVMERLVRHPEGPVEINSQLIGVTDTDDDNENTNGSLNFKKGVELADVGLCILEGEREKLAKHIRNIDDEAEKEATELREHQAKQQREKQQREQAALKQKQQPSKPAAQQQQPKQPAKQPSGEKQAQKAMKSPDQKANGGESNRVGRRRNKLNNLRKNRNLNNSKKPQKPGLSNSGHDMNKTKRRGGKQGGATDTKRSSSDGKKQARARAAAKAASNTDRHDDSSASDDSSAVSTTESSKQVNSVVTEAFKNCGYEFHFKLPAEVMNQVDQCLRDIAKMNKVVKAVATNGRGTVFLYGNGGVAYTPAIPKALYQKLRQLRSSSFSSRPCFVALGTRDRYYVSFNDGSADWKGSSSLDKVLKKRVQKRGDQADGHPSNDGAANLPRSVAFGATYDTFFVVFNDGSWEYQGRSIPKSLEKKLRERDNAADIVICNLGPNGEWFLKAESGKMWWSGITPELDMVLKKITKTGYLHNMDFGENGSYFVSYDEE